MATIFSYAYTRIRHTIPMRVLQQAFSTDADMQPYPRNMVWTDALYDQVLASRVLMDMNLRGGEEVRVDTSKVTKHYPEANTVVFTIPPDLVRNRAIISVQEFTYTQGLSNLMTGNLSPHGYNNNLRSDFVSASNRMVNALSSVETQGNATADVIGPYSIRVRNETRLTDIAAVRVFVENDSNLANIKMPYWDGFADLVKYATMSYIYTKLRTEIGMGVMVGGQALGVVSDIINEYADAEELYTTALQKWGRLAAMNDRARHDRVLQAQIPMSL